MRNIHPTPFSHLLDEELERLARELAKRWFDTIEVTSPECDVIFDTNL